MSSVSLWDVAARPEVHSKGPSHSRSTPTLLPALLALAPTPAALNAVPDFETPAVWGEITEKSLVGLGAKKERGQSDPWGARGRAPCALNTTHIYSSAQSTFPRHWEAMSPGERRHEGLTMGGWE